MDHIHVKKENIYQRIVHHVVSVHVDIIVQDEHGIRVQQMTNERINVTHENIVELEQKAVVSVIHDRLQIQHNVAVR